MYRSNNHFMHNDTKKIIDQLPEGFIEKYKNASKSEKMILISSLNDYICKLSNRRDVKDYLKKELDIDL